MDEDESKYKGLDEVIEGAYLGMSIPSLTGSKAKVYDLELAMELLVKDGTSVRDAYEYIRRLNNRYIGGPNHIFVADTEHPNLGFSLEVADG